MGCCGSRHSGHDDDDVPTERTRLLNDCGLEADATNTSYTYQPPMAVTDLAAEEEQLKMIVQRTSDNFIDISSTNVSERLQQQDLAYRSREYSEILKNVVFEEKKFSSFDDDKSETATISDLSAERILGWASSIKQEDIDLMDKAISQVLEAVKTIKVEDVEDIVVPLSWPET